MDPTAVEFTASTDHDALGSNGQPVVFRYDLLLIRGRIFQPDTVVSLGKPSPDDGGTIRMALASIFEPDAGGRNHLRSAHRRGRRGWLGDQRSLEQLLVSRDVHVRRDAVEPLSRRRRWLCQLFCRRACRMRVELIHERRMDRNGRQRCGNRQWQRDVRRREQSELRFAQRVDHDRRSQRLCESIGIACSFTVSPTSRTVERTGGVVSVSVEAPGGCPWSASAQAPWISITDGASGSGDGTVTFAIAANSAQDPRSTVITVAGHSIVVAQAPATPPAAPNGMRIIGE